MNMARVSIQPMAVAILVMLFAVISIKRYSSSEEEYSARSKVLDGQSFIKHSLMPIMDVRPRIGSVNELPMFYLIASQFISQ